MTLQRLHVPENLWLNYYKEAVIALNCNTICLGNIKYSIASVVLKSFGLVTNRKSLMNLIELKNFN